MDNRIKLARINNSNKNTSNTYGESIIFHSRRLYLKSRGGEKKGAKLPPIFTSKRPCKEEKLLPPVELMTRTQAMKYAYYRKNKPANFVKPMVGLVRKEDQRSVKRREEILDRIRAAEVKAAMRQKENRKRVEEEKSSDEEETNDVCIQHQDATVDARGKVKTHKKDRRKSSLVNLVGLVRQRRRSTIDYIFGANGKNSQKMPFSTMDDSDKEEEAYPENFAFLADWGLAENALQHYG